MATAAQPGIAPRTQAIVLAPLAIAGFLAFFFLPMKSLHVDVGVTIYIPYVAIVIVAAYRPQEFINIYWKFFSKPILVLLLFSVFDIIRTGDLTVIFFALKIMVAAGLSCAYIAIMRYNERMAFKYFEWGIRITVMYMVYQAISGLFFGFNLPFTRFDSPLIGHALGFRFGLIRTTGITEEPSFVAIHIISAFFVFRSFEKRSGISQKSIIKTIIIGLCLGTSDSLFATIPLVMWFSYLYRIRQTWFFFVSFYLVNLAVFPFVLNKDESFFARFSSYSIWVGEPLFNKIFGIGFNQYKTLDTVVWYRPDGIPGLIIDSIASLWGGLLLEGGIAFTILFWGYVNKITNLAKDGTGYALMATLIMLANYYSPWWPIASLTLAYALHSNTPYRAVEGEREPEQPSAQAGDAQVTVAA